MAATAATTTRLIAQPGLRLVTLAGEDATDFLEAQAMTPLKDRDAGRVLTCGIADNKGRVIALARAWHEGGNWTLVVPADQADWLVEHLLRFRFRSRVDIEAPPEYRVVAVFGEAVAAALEGAGLPSPPSRHVAAGDGVTVATLSNGRHLLIGTNTAIEPPARELAASCAASGPEYWHGACMQAREVAVYEATRGRFLPQWLDLDHAEGVIGWKKGCYPGQEVIARLQHRGAVKKRLMLLATRVEAARGEKTEVSGVEVEIVDHGHLEYDGPVVQVVTPFPFDPALESLAL